MYCEDSNESYVKQEGPSIETLIIADATHSNNNDRDTPSPQTNPFETSVINPAINQTRAVLNNILGQPLFNHYEPRFEINSQAIAPATKENFKIPNLEVLSPKVTASFVSALGPPPPKKKQKTHEPPVMRDGYLVYVCEKCGKYTLCIVRQFFHSDIFIFYVYNIFDVFIRFFQTHHTQRQTRNIIAAPDSSARFVLRRLSTLHGSDIT